MITRRKIISSLFPLFHSPVPFLLALFTPLLFVSTVLASSWYVKPSSELPIRSGQGTEYKILAVLPDGVKVEILKEEDPWVMIRTAGGNEGWMLKRYLSNDPPLSAVVERLEAQKTKLEEENNDANQKLVDISAAHSELEKEFELCLADRNTTRESYEVLQNDTADVIKTKESLAAKIQENKDLKQKLAAIEQLYNDLKRNTTLMWFLAGGGLLLIGWIIGMMSGKSRKRKSSLL